MPIEFSCPSCLTSIRVPDNAAGKQAKCPACNGVCAVPMASAPPVDQLFGASLTEGSNPYATSPSRHLQSVGGGMPLASRGARFAARVIDVFLMVVPTVVMAVGFFLAIHALEREAAVSAGAIIAGVLGAFGLLIVGMINVVWMAKSGETIGKRMMKIRVVLDANGHPPGFLNGVVLRSWLMALLSQVPFVGLVDVLMIFGDKRQCLHDLIASTRVVEGSYSGRTLSQ